jgi:hypothetical protein
VFVNGSELAIIPIPCLAWKLIQVYGPIRGPLSIVCRWVPKSFLMGELTVRTEPSRLVHFQVDVKTDPTFVQNFDAATNIWVVYIIYGAATNVSSNIIDFF